MANIEVTVHARTSAPPAAVFNVIADPGRMPLWIKGVESAEFQPGDTFEPGGRFTMKYRYGRRVNDITMEITASDSRRVEYHTVSGPYPIEAKFNLMPSAEGTAISYTQNALADSKMASFSFKVTGWIARPMMRKQLRKDLSKLVEIVDGVPGITSNGSGSH